MSLTKKINLWKWSTAILSLSLLVGGIFHLSTVNRIREENLKTTQKVRDWITITSYCDELKYSLLKGQMEKKMYAPFPEEDAIKCKASIPGFDPEIPNYVDR
jgi:hypothetical protein